MRFVCSLALLLASLPALGTSISCPGGASLSDYMNPGFSCREGPLTFSNFAFSSSIEGNAPLITSLDVYVEPEPLGFYGFTFYSDFRAGDLYSPCGTEPAPDCIDNESTWTQGGSQTTNISYSIKGPVTSATIWLGSVLYGTDFDGAIDIWDLEASFTCSGQQSCLPNLDSGNFFNPWTFPDTATCSPVCTSLGMANSLYLYTSVGNTVEASNGMINYFTVAPPAIPEPSSVALLGAGLLGGIGLLRVVTSKRRKYRNDPS